VLAASGSGKWVNESVAGPPEYDEAIAEMPMRIAAAITNGFIYRSWSKNPVALLLTRTTGEKRQGPDKCPSPASSLRNMLRCRHAPGMATDHMNAWNKVDILLVEDNLSDAELTVRALRKIGATQKVLRLSDGAEALDFIFRKARFSERDETLPKLILLDLKMPRVGGVEFLRRLREDAATNNIAVAILTSAVIDKNFLENQDFKIRSYLSKPVDAVKLADIVESAGL
jgi:CheY-like chemotaxis protein